MKKNQKIKNEQNNCLNDLGIKQLLWFVRLVSLQNPFSLCIFNLRLSQTIPHYLQGRVISSLHSYMKVSCD